MLGIKEIEEIIPHRHPFLLVDCIEELVPGDRLKLICEVDRVKGPVGRGKAVAYVGEEKAVEAELTFIVGA